MRNARACLDGGKDGIAVGRDAQASGAHGGSRQDFVSLRFIDHARDRCRSPLERGVGDDAVLLESLTEARHLRAVDDGAPLAVTCTLADVELDRIGADVDHRKAQRLAVDQRGKAAGVARVHVAAQTQAADGGDDRSGVLGFDGDRARRSAVRDDFGKLGHAPAQGVARSSLVHADGANAAARHGELADELLQAVVRAAQRQRIEAERLEHLGHLGRRQRESRLHDGRPLFQTVAIHLAQNLDVHECVAHLHVVPGPGKQVGLAALLDADRSQCGQL